MLWKRNSFAIITHMYEYLLAHTEEEYATAAMLFREYAAWLNIDLRFQHFDEELASINRMYSLPAGGIILCKCQEEYIGCVGIRKQAPGTAEMKRMYVRSAYRNKGIANELVERALLFAKESGYSAMRLDTLNYMTPAMNLYKKYGFVETHPYYHNPNETVVYFEKKL